MSFCWPLKRVAAVLLPHVLARLDPWNQLELKGTTPPTPRFPKEIRPYKRGFPAGLIKGNQWLRRVG